ncbi:unnamed protein product [Spirodela intermedia]|uniref:TFIIS N-terminal domain-containing protein n=1 Tax=Spirodela intermedia TaxID=51605 RepID=A0A7I8ICA3_SPIIN|nr:unnamed protein product [Spirodela intermedia]CAA6654994.1 unnamed protein product [Spirodela intermedia]
MGYENDPYVDEDGEPLMDPDAHFYREASPVPVYRLEDDDAEDDWRRERSPTPVHGSAVEKGGKQRKRLVKKSGRESSPWRSGKKGKGKSKPQQPLGKPSKSGSKGYEGFRDHGRDSELNEMWNTVAGGDSEDDQEGIRTMDDDAFIDDSGVDPADRFGSDNEGDFLRNAPQAEEGEEDEEINRLFKGGKKKKKTEKSPAELALVVEHLMAELEVTAEEDAELNRQSKPAINKLKKLPLLIEVLSKKNLQQEFLDHGVLTVLKNWLEPLPDGSLPNMNIRSAILKILTDFPIDLEQYDRREQLKRAAWGRGVFIKEASMEQVIMFLSKSDEETTANRRLAKDLVDKWSRPIFNKSTRFEDMRGFDDERIPYRRPPMKKQVSKAAGLESRDDDLDEFHTGQGASRQHASRPEPLPLDFVVRPQSKIDPDEIRARAKQVSQDQRRLKEAAAVEAPKKKQLQATKLSVEGRGMVKYL